MIASCTAAITTMMIPNNSPAHSGSLPQGEEPGTWRGRSYTHICPPSVESETRVAGSGQGIIGRLVEDDGRSLSKWNTSTNC